MTTLLTKGANTLVSASAKEAIIIRLSWKVPASYEVDASAFLLNPQNQVDNDDGMVFFNQPVSPDQAIHFHADKHLFTLALNKLNVTVQKIAFTLTLYQGTERGQALSALSQAFIQVIKGSEELARYQLTGAELNQETALIMGELYLNKGQWKFRAIGQGFNGGLAAMCVHFGVSVAEEAEVTAPPVAQHSPQSFPVNNKQLISLEKKLEKAPVLLSLAKQAYVSLEKVNLTAHKAHVALCLDISASMETLYRDGKIQRLAEKVLALGCQFSDQATIEVFLFGEKAHQLPALGIADFAQFTQRLLIDYPLEWETCYGKVMKLIRNFYFPPEISVNKPLLTHAEMPVYVMFVTDGNTADKQETLRQMKGSSYQPIFWQFMAIAHPKQNQHDTATAQDETFSFLAGLDGMTDRYINNAHFFSVTDPEALTTPELYEALMTNYPHWLTLARQQTMLP